MINTDKTIYALSTVFGKSGIAVIRISGKDALKSLKYFNVKKDIKPRFAHLVDLYDNLGQLIDTGIVIYFPAPNSFTGEDVIELQVHGSKAVIKIILEELSKEFFIAKPGEFSFRAFLNGKFNLIQIEGIADLINSETKIQAKQSIKQISGELDKLYNSWRKKLIKIQSKIEAYIDFPEEIIIEKNFLKKIDNEIQSLIYSIKKHLDDNKLGERLREGLHVVITGEPNVGKSTLFNFLVNRDIAIVSKYPGTTRDILEANIDIEGYPIIIYDTAGIRDSSDPIELEGINRAIKKSREADLIIKLFSFENRFNIDCDFDKDTIYVLSKADDINDYNNIKINNIDFLPLSILKDIGKEKLISIIKKKVEEKFGCDREIPFIIKKRHKDYMNRAIKYLQNFNVNNPIELISEDLRFASIELSSITGIIDTNEILDTIFSNFCVGK